MEQQNLDLIQPNSNLIETIRWGKGVLEIGNVEDAIFTILLAVNFAKIAVPLGLEVHRQDMVVLNTVVVATAVAAVDTAVAAVATAAAVATVAAVATAAVATAAVAAVATAAVVVHVIIIVVQE